MTSIDVQLDRLVGPTHHFGGLGVGNRASIEHAGEVSHPAAAAIEGLDKMRLVSQLGQPQWMLPPQRRPAMSFLRSLGFSGSDRDVLEAAWLKAPTILSAACSCSATWTANAATVTAAADSHSGRLQMTIANLSSSMHRALEPEETHRQLKQLIANMGLSQQIDLHPALPAGLAFRDEGAANHMRLTGRGNSSGFNVLVSGDGDPLPRRYVPRQSRSAFDAIARQHGLDEARTFHLKQHPAAIDAGAFHNDVVAMSHGNLLIHHELAFWEGEETLALLEERFQTVTGTPLQRVIIPDSQLPLDAAISTYLFNSQWLGGGDGETARIMICPAQVREHEAAMRWVRACRDEQGWCDEVHFVSVEESMAGGGGPACLRLRIPVDPSQLPPRSTHACWSETLDERLRQIILAEYPEQLTLVDLIDPERVRHLERTTERIEQLILGS